MASCHGTNDIFLVAGSTTRNEQSQVYVSLQCGFGWPSDFEDCGDAAIPGCVRNPKLQRTCRELEGFLFITLKMDGLQLATPEIFT